MADDWRTPDVEALFDGDPRASTTSTRPSASSATSARSTSCATWPSAGRSSACSTRACTTRRSRARPAPARRRSPGSPRGSTTARAAIARSTARVGRRPAPTRPRAMRERLRLAIPNKGRLVEPTLRLLHDAGLVFEEHDRSLVARVQNYDLDILFVRTNDVIEFVGDGVADLGITGDRPARRDRRRAAPGPRARLRPLPARRRGPERHALPDASRTSPACASRPPTRTPPAGSSRSAASPVDVIPISGAVEVAPRLGLAEGDRRPRLDRLDARHERPPPDRRRPRVGGGPRRQPDRRPRARRRARRDRHDAQRGHRRARPQVPDDERPGRQAARARGACSRRSSRRRSSRSPTTG